MKPLKTEFHGDIVVIEYHGEHPHSVVTTKGTYDFDQTKDGKTYCNCSGSGAWEPYRHGLSRYERPVPPPCSIWVADGVRLTEHLRHGKEVPCSWKRALEIGYRRLESPLGDPFELALEGETTECFVCEGMVSEDELCGHLFWSDGYGVAGPGDGEEEHGWLKDGFIRMVNLTGCARTLRRELKKRRGMQVYTIDAMISVSYEVTIGGRRFYGFDKLGEEDRDPARWLECLSEKTPKAIEETLVWLEEAIRQQEARQRSGERCYAVSYRGKRTKRMSWAEAVEKCRGTPKDEYQRRIVRLVDLSVLRALKEMKETNAPVERFGWQMQTHLKRHGLVEAHEIDVPNRWNGDGVVEGWTKGKDWCLSEKGLKRLMDSTQMIAEAM